MLRRSFECADGDLQSKATLQATYGPAATSLGTVATERAWWQDHLRSLNRTAVWSSNAARQYRAAVGSKQGLRVSLRALLPRLKSHAALQELLETRSASQELGADPLFVPSGMPDEPTVDAVNGFFDAFRKHVSD